MQGERAGIMDDMARLTVEAAAVGRALKVGRAALGGCAGWLEACIMDLCILKLQARPAISPPCFNLHLLLLQAAAKEREGRQDPQSLHPAFTIIRFPCRPPPRSGRAGWWRWT